MRYRNLVNLIGPYDRLIITKTTVLTARSGKAGHGNRLAATCSLLVFALLSACASLRGRAMVCAAFSALCRHALVCVAHSAALFVGTTFRRCAPFRAAPSCCALVRAVIPPPLLSLVAVKFFCVAVLAGLARVRARCVTSLGCGRPSVRLFVRRVRSAV